MRVVPDVAMDADPLTGFLIGLTGQLPGGGVSYGESSIGGTSLATPLFAGMTADATQAAGHPLGFLNPSLYAHAISGVFHDVTGTSLDAAAPVPGQGPLAEVVDFGFDRYGVHRAQLFQLGDDGLLAATPGYDDVTGVGSPSGAYLRSYRWPHV
jgi:subtilase family serine protease